MVGSMECPSSVMEVGVSNAVSHAGGDGMKNNRDNPTAKMSRNKKKCLTVNRVKKDECMM